jgi:hypothetical protein
MTSLRARLVSGTVPASLSVRSIEGTAIFIRLCSLRASVEGWKPRVALDMAVTTDLLCQAGHHRAGLGDENCEPEEI